MNITTVSASVSPFRLVGGMHPTNRLSFPSILSCQNILVNVVIDKDLFIDVYFDHKRISRWRLLKKSKQFDLDFFCPVLYFEIFWLGVRFKTTIRVSLLAKCIYLVNEWCTTVLGYSVSNRLKLIVNHLTISDLFKCFKIEFLGYKR